MVEYNLGLVDRPWNR